MTRLLLTFIALLALLLATIGVNFLQLGLGNLALNLGIAAAKAILIGLYFMHLSAASALVRSAAFAGLVWLALLFGLSATDYALREISYEAPLEDRLLPGPR